MTVHERSVAALARPADGDGGERITLASPSPGLFRIAVRAGDLVRPGSVLGELEILGRRIAVTAPEGVRGAVVATCAEGLARPAVDHGAVLATIDPRALAGSDALGAGAAAAGAAAAGSAAAGRAFRAPTSGRFYGRPSPEKPAFVGVGDQLVPGATVCLLEVMKTFQRVTYSGEPGRVVRILVRDAEDVNAGDALLVLE